MTIADQAHDFPERDLTGPDFPEGEFPDEAGGAPLDDPPELNLEVPEDAPETPDDPSAALSAASPEDETDPEEPSDDPDAAPEDVAPVLADLDLPVLAEGAGVGAMESELAAISSLDEVVANELANRLNSQMMGLDDGAETEAPEAQDAKPESVSAFDSDMIEAPGEGMDLMTVLASLVMGDAVPVDLMAMADPKKWRYDEDILKQLAERNRPDTTPEDKQDRFRVNARTIVAASAAVLALITERQARAENAAAPAQKNAGPDAGAAKTRSGTPGASAAAVRPVPVQEQAPAPGMDDALRLAARRQEEQRRLDAQTTERERQRHQAAMKIHHDNQAASAPVATQAGDDMYRMMMLDLMSGGVQPAGPQSDMMLSMAAQPGTASSGPAMAAVSAMAPDTGAGTVAAPAAVPERGMAGLDTAGRDMAARDAVGADRLRAAGMSREGESLDIADAGPGGAGSGADMAGMGDGPGDGLAARSFLGGLSSLASLFRENVFSVTAPSWSTPDRPGWQVALNDTAPVIERDPVQPAVPAVTQAGPEMLRPA